MKNFISGIVLLFFLVMLGSCASLTLSQEEIDAMQRRLQPGEQVIGTVQAMASGALFNTSKFWYDGAYETLLETAKRQYQGDIDIRDIEIDFSQTTTRTVALPATGKVIQR